MDATGDAYTLVSPNEEGNLRAIEGHIGERLPRQKVPGFDYAQNPQRAATKQSFHGLFGGRSNGKADWRGNDSTTQTRRAWKTWNTSMERDRHRNEARQG